MTEIWKFSRSNGSTGLLYDTLDYLKSHNTTPPYGYKGGGSYKNDGRYGSQVLPDCHAPYYKYDVHPKIPGQNRGLERIVLGQGIAYYTFDHYITCIIME